MSQRTDLFSKLLDRNGRWIEVADTKAGVVLVFATAVLKELIAPQLADARMVLVSLQQSGAWTQVRLPYVFLLFLLITTFFALRAMYHAFKAINPTLTRRQRHGHIFFGDIAKHTDLAAYQRQLLALKAEEVDEQLIEQIHTTAHIALTKHRHVGQAINSIISVIPLGLLLYILGLYVP